MWADDITMADAASEVFALETDEEDMFIMAAMGQISLSRVIGENEQAASQIEVIYDRSVNLGNEKLQEGYDIALFMARSVTVPSTCTLLQLQEAVLGDLNRSNFDIGLRARNYIIKHTKCEQSSTSRFNGCYCHGFRSKWYPLQDENTPASATLQEMGLRPGHYKVQVCVPNPDRR